MTPEKNPGNLLFVLICSNQIFDRNSKYTYITKCRYKFAAIWKKNCEKKKSVFVASGLDVWSDEQVTYTGKAIILGTETQSEVHFEELIR